MNDSSLAKLVVTIMLLIAFALWHASDRPQRLDCGINCPTDISASRK